MILMTHCSHCTRKGYCNTILVKLKNIDFPNIIVVADCNDLRLPDGLAVGLSVNTELRDVFNHCDDCDFVSKCKYVNNPEMLKEIDRVRELCIKRGYDKVRFTCNIHRSIHANSEKSTGVTISSDNKKSKFFSRNKKGK